MDHPYPWLRYLDADDLDEPSVDFDGMSVESPKGEHLGDVDGFIVDSESGRPYYVVVDSGGWFKSRHFLLPIGHVTFDAGNEALKVDLDRDRVERFPGFNRDDFDRLTPDDVRRLNEDTLRACVVTGGAFSYPEAEGYWVAWERSDFDYPDWWRRERDIPAAPRGGVMAERAERASRPADYGAPPARSGEAAIAHADPSPHFDGRAQPGDVIGVETDGEQTHLGDTADDENRRREAAEREAADRARSARSG